MTRKTLHSNKELKYSELNARRQKQQTLFDENPTPCYWNLSDLAILYPDLFDIKKPISKNTIHKMNTEIFNHIPEFKNLAPQPIHVLNTKQAYNVYIPNTNQIETITNGTQQKISVLACEYLFRQFYNTEFEQAYFLHPNKNFEELVQIEKDIKFEHIRNQVIESTNTISAIINRSCGATSDSAFQEIWPILWHVMYNVENMDELRDKFNVKSSPLNYMKPQTLIYMNSVFHEIILYFQNMPKISLSDIKNIMYTKAILVRKRFQDYKSTPEEQLLDKNSYNIIRKIHDARKKFQKTYYPLSLQH